jgi:hypothetical protein
MSLGLLTVIGSLTLPEFIAAVNIAQTLMPPY